MIDSKIYLNKTCFLLRMLPDKNRERLCKFIKEEREYGPSYIAVEMFNNLTGSLNPSMKSIYASINFSRLGDNFFHYPVCAPYFEVTIDQERARKFYKDLFETSKVICKQPEESLNIYLEKIKAPNTSYEKIKRAFRKVHYNMKETIKAKMPHYIACITNPHYRKLIKNYKITEINRLSKDNQQSRT